MITVEERQIEYMARTIMPEIYKRQEASDIAFETFIKQYFENCNDKTDDITDGE